MLPEVSTGNCNVSEGQLSCQPPPTSESTTCETLTSFQPGARGTSMNQPPLSSARVVKTRAPTFTLTSAPGCAQYGGSCWPGPAQFWPGPASSDACCVDRLMTRETSASRG